MDFFSGIKLCTGYLKLNRYITVRETKEKISLSLFINNPFKKGEQPDLTTRQITQT